MNASTIFEQFRSDLLAQSAISGVFGARVYFGGTVPKGATLPAISLTPSAAPTDAPYLDSRGLSELSIQVSIFSENGIQSMAAYDTIVTRYNGFSGNLNGNSSALVSKVDVDQMFTYPDSNNSNIITTVFDINISYNGA